MTSPTDALTGNKPPNSCAFGYCRAALVDRGRSVYCCQDHADASRRRQTAEAEAARAREAVYERIALGQQDPVAHLGVVTTTAGVVLDGTAVLELRALLTEHRRAIATYGQHLKRPGVTVRDADFQFGVTIGGPARGLVDALERLLPAPKSHP